MVREKESPEGLEAALMSLRSQLLNAGFAEEKVDRVIEQARTLEQDAVYRGLDDNDQPYRITRHETGYEFDTDADVT